MPAVTTHRHGAHGLDNLDDLPHEVRLHVLDEMSLDVIWRADTYHRRAKIPNYVIEVVAAFDIVTVMYTEV